MMMRIQSYRGLLAAALLLAAAGGVAAQEFRATVHGQVVDTSKARCRAQRSPSEPDTNEVASATTNAEGELHHPLPSARVCTRSPWS